MRLKKHTPLILAFFTLHSPLAFSGDWWSGSQRTSFDTETKYIGTDLYAGHGQIVLSCTRQGPKAKVILNKSRLSSGILFEMQVDNKNWIKNANRPQYNNSFETYMIHHLIEPMKKGKEIHLTIDGHRHYSGSLMGFTKASQQLECL